MNILFGSKSSAISIFSLFFAMKQIFCSGCSCSIYLICCNHHFKYCLPIEYHCKQTKFVVNKASISEICTRILKKAWISGSKSVCSEPCSQFTRNLNLWFQSMWKRSYTKAELLNSPLNCLHVKWSAFWSWRKINNSLEIVAQCPKV